MYATSIGTLTFAALLLFIKECLRSWQRVSDCVFQGRSQTGVKYVANLYRLRYNRVFVIRTFSALLRKCLRYGIYNSRVAQI